MTLAPVPFHTRNACGCRAEQVAEAGLGLGGPAVGAVGQSVAGVRRDEGVEHLGQRAGGVVAGEGALRAPGASLAIAVLQRSSSAAFCNTVRSMDRDDYLDHLGADIERFAAALERGPLDAPVPWCGEWRLADLGEHLGGVHRWATGVRQPAAAAPPPGSGAGRRRRDGGVAACRRRVRCSTRSRAVDLDADGVEPVPGDQRRRGVAAPSGTGGVGAPLGRRAGRSAWTRTIDPALAADGIDEYFALALPAADGARGRRARPTRLAARAHHRHRRRVARRRRRTARSSRPTAIRRRRSPARPSSVLLALWRRPVPDGAVDVAGDRAWLALGGI